RFPRRPRPVGKQRLVARSSGGIAAAQGGRRRVGAVGDAGQRPGAADRRRTAEALLPKLPAIEYADLPSATVQAAEQSAPWGISAGKMGLWAVLSNITTVAINAVFTSAAPV